MRIFDVRKARLDATNFDSTAEFLAGGLLEACDEIDRLLEILAGFLHDAQGNGFIGDNAADALAWAARQMGENCRLRISNDRGVEVFERAEAKRRECEAECQRLREIMDRLTIACTSRDFGAQQKIIGDLELQKARAT